LHLHNEELLKPLEERASWVKESHGEFTVEPVRQFGFHTTTCCGYIPMNNSWSSSWEDFYTRQRLKPQVEMVLAKTGDKELEYLWPQLEKKISSFFTDCQDIKPALLHGDLWGGNVAETKDGPVIFDPASFYGHSEFEFGILTLFGGFSRPFFEAYRKLIPKSKGFDSRLPLYQLFHYLNHWNHFGAGYRGSSLSILRSLVK
uniref:protein-ribulosamine 3-kinase n=1 Tax=Soboliphyme baturini TaxID=241478 RepID=A0A183J627_9BILA